MVFFCRWVKEKCRQRLEGFRFCLCRESKGGLKAGLSGRNKQNRTAGPGGSFRERTARPILSRHYWIVEIE